MTEQELLSAMTEYCPKLQPPPSPGFDGQYQGVHDPRRNMRSSVTNQEALILSSLAEGKRVLEIGSGVGVSTVALAHKAKHVVSVDPDEWVQEVLAGIPNVTIIPDVFKATGPFDMAFIDGLHDFVNVCLDVENALLLVKPDGLFAFHDMGHADVGAAVNSFKWAAKIEHPTLGLLTVCKVNA